jgi:hypothetical protein
MRAVARLQGRKILALAKDILENGLNPAEALLVTPAKDREKRFIALEGNRRLVALKALENPDFFVGALDGRTLSAIRTIARKYQDSPVESIQCCVVKNRREAEHWISLRHTGENEGAGIVRWGADEANRFRARGGPKDLSVQALDYLERHGAMTPEQRSRVPVTSLKRLLATPEVRGKLGLTFQNRELKVCADDKKVVAALKHVTDDLSADGGTKVADIYTHKQREGYAAKLPQSIVVKPQEQNARSIESSAPRAKTRAKGGRKGKQARARSALIPSDCVLGVTQQRISDIEGELRSLALETYPNAISVLFRVFLELSVDEYIQANALARTADDKLRAKLEAVVTDLVSKKKLTSQQAKPVRRAMAKDSYLAPSIDSMNNYIHNQNFFPAPADLRAHWSSLQPFVAAIWAP